MDTLWTISETACRLRPDSGIYVPLAIPFIPLAIPFVPLAIPFVPLAIPFS